MQSDITSAHHWQTNRHVLEIIQWSRVPYYPFPRHQHDAFFLLKRAFWPGLPWFSSSRKSAHAESERERERERERGGKKWPLMISKSQHVYFTAFTLRRTTLTLLVRLRCSVDQFENIKMECRWVWARRWKTKKASRGRKRSAGE